MRKDDTPMWDDPNESPFVRDLLRSARQNPVAYDVERGLAEHLARIATGAAAPPWAEVGAVAKTAMPAWLGYVILPLAAAGVAGLAWVFTGQPATPKAAESPTVAAVATVSAPDLQSARLDVPPVPAPAAVTVSGEGAARAVQPAASEPNSRSSRRHGRSSRSPATGSESATGNATTANSEFGGIAHGLGSTGSNGLAAQTDSQRPSHAAEAVAAPQPEAAERREPEEQAAPKPAKAAQAKADAAPLVDESRLEREMQMLAVTQRVLASNPSRALRLSQQGEREFPNTMFSAERRQLGLLALVKLGRLDEARRVGQPFLEKYPNAPWSERLRRALASGVVE